MKDIVLRPYECDEEDCEFCELLLFCKGKGSNNTDESYQDTYEVVIL